MKIKQRQTREEIDKVTPILKRLDFVHKDIFVHHSVLDARLEEVKEYYQAKIDMRMNHIESNFQEQLKATETKCFNKILNRVSKADFEAHLTSLRWDLRDSRHKIAFI